MTLITSCLVLCGTWLPGIQHYLTEKVEQNPPQNVKNELPVRFLSEKGSGCRVQVCVCPKAPLQTQMKEYKLLIWKDPNS